MERLVETAWSAHRAAADQSWLVTPSAPVLFFGDHRAFKASTPRVATVALNPSKLEFPADDPFRRFPDALDPDPCRYLATLDGYFRADPYRPWFESYDQALRGMGVSYYDGEQGTAVHTDIGSVLPTNPTWSGLSRAIRDKLSKAGVPLWHELIERLQPDVLLWSIAWEWMSCINLRPLSTWQCVATFGLTDGGKPRKHPVQVETRWFGLASGRPVLVAFIPAAQTPLGRLSHRQKFAAGTHIAERWRNGF